MRTPTTFALLAALALAVAAVPAPVSPARAAEESPPPRAKELPYASSAIAVVVEANGGRVPASGRELQEALQKLGNFAQLPVTFSAVALDSGLTSPRVVITMRPSPSTQTVMSGGWSGLSRPGPGRLVATPLSTQPANKPHLEGRLFLAANMEVPAPWDAPRVKTVEFISWNSRRLKFDFGVIEGLGGTPELKFLDGARCFSCHKNRGPILGAAPWSNTAHNDLVRGMSAPLFFFEPKTPAFGTPPDAELRNDIDGMTVLMPNAPEVDEGVRMGAEFLRNRELFKALNRTHGGRKAFVFLLAAIVQPGPLDKIDKQIRADLNDHDLIRFIADALAIQRAAPPSLLIDFSPSGSMGKVTGTRTTWGGTTSQLTGYSAARAEGDHGMPAAHLPSNPKAFHRPPVKVSNQPSDFVGAVMLARTIGLTEEDRTFLTQALATASRHADKPGVTPASLAREVFRGPSFADVLDGGELPDRDDFKDRFVSGLMGALRQHRFFSEDFWVKREQYASAPKRDPAGAAEADAEVVPTTTCLRCHDVRGAGKPPSFSPIPLLAFDPFDAAGREAWVKTADRKRKAEVLARFLRRLGTDKDMPPEDSAEYELFRVKDPAAFDAAKEWLEAELKKAKGN